MCRHKIKQRKATDNTPYDVVSLGTITVVYVRFYTFFFKSYALFLFLISEPNKGDIELPGIIYVVYVIV
ncbi:hypothetical protein [Butyrivibrio sp. AE3006]|uniref:hypothetical protein n=1 Tax=Butyrivibrio sp. AE3006 TaxID=1280673 RepID=UPI0012DD76D3|nr:hypothetical protein [Butyrivibrio sp. AE3006]